MSGRPSAHANSRSIEMHRLPVTAYPFANNHELALTDDRSYRSRIGIVSIEWRIIADFNKENGC